MSEFETQGRRWVKYGGNVALSSAVVVALACGVVWIAQRNPKRIDTTLAGVYSLKPQTKGVLKAVPGKVRIVSLYSNPETAGKSGTALKQAEEERRYAATVADLLSEYSKSSNNVSIEFIDPGRESDKVDALVAEVTAKYGAELKPYEDFFQGYPEFVGKFKTFATAQSGEIEKVAIDEAAAQEVAQSFFLAKVTVLGLPETMERAQKQIDPFLKRKPVPDYAGAARQVTTALQDLDQLLSATISGFRSVPAAAPAAVKGYVEKALPEYEAAEKLVTEQLERAKGLAELKLDSLREAIKRNTVVVMGDKEMRVLGFNDVWKAPDDLKAYLNNSGADRPALKFAGEQQISTALLAISQPKKLAIVVRGAGAPLTQATFRAPMFSQIANRLKDANFEVVEKDVSGQFAMAAMQQGMPVQEASEEQMKDRSAIWIVFSLAPPMSQGNPMMGGGPMPSALPGKLKEHLAEGGSALVLVEPDRDNLEAALSDYGVAARTEAIIVKRPPDNTAAAASADIVQQATKSPFIFLTSRYGTHPLTEPVNGLQGIFLPVVPIQYTAAAGRTGTPLVPIQLEVPTWGETDMSIMEGGTPVFDAGKDVEKPADGPLYGGVAVERTGAGGPGGRLVVFGSATIASNQILTFPDPELAKGNNPVLVPRFPANAELLLNSVYWLARMDTMLAISPAAMEVSRVRDIPEGQLAFVRWGVLTIGLPGLVVLAGLGVYLARRD